MIWLGALRTACVLPAIDSSFHHIDHRGRPPRRLETVDANRRQPAYFYLIYGLAGGPPEGREVKAWFPGGSSAPVLTAAELDLPYSFEALADAGSMLGSGSIIVADDSVSIPALALRTARFYHHESCGKCTPCREGTNWTVKMLERVISGEATPMDLDVIASVQDNIIGHCLCVLGDSMAMPVASMVAKFRGEFEARIRRVATATRRVRAPTERQVRTHRPRLRPCAAGGDRMLSRPQITVVIDGVEVAAPQGRCWSTPPSTATSRSRSSATSRSSANRSAPAACAWWRSRGSRSSRPRAPRRCATGWSSTPRTQRVKEAQNAIVEFLLVNHPLDCPVCDKGGECPLQDIAMGWGPGRSRVIDPKRHFQKPIPLSPLIKIDRERCILCYRCVRFSQEVAEDEQLQLLERGSSTFVGTFDDRPYIAPFHGNIIELCPVGALTSDAYRFRARPWDIEDAGTVCTLCPSQCNIKLTVRDERIQRVLARDNVEVDDGWLCDKGRFGYQMAESDERITEPMVRVGGELRAGELGARRSRPRRPGLRDAGERTAAIVGGSSSNEEGYLAQRIARRPWARRTWSHAPPVDRASSHGAPGTAAGHDPPRPGRALAARAGRERRRPRPRRVDPRARHRPASFDADPGPADPKGRAPRRRPRWPWPRTGRAPSTAAPRRRRATRPGSRGAFASALAAEAGRRGIRARPGRARRRRRAHRGDV